MVSDKHPMDVMAELFEAEADDPSCFEPEDHVRLKYRDLFHIEAGSTEWEDKDTIDGSFYYIHPNNLYITVAIENKPDCDDGLSIEFSIWTSFVYHSDEKYCTASVEISAELLNSESKCLHEFDFCGYKEWTKWPDVDVFKTFVVGEINSFLVNSFRVDPVGIDNVR